MDLEKQTILIIAATLGIGFNVATLAACAGAQLVITGPERKKTGRGSGNAARHKG